MKRLTILMASLFAALSILPASAGNDRIIVVGELPAAAQQFITTHFKGVEVSYAKVDEDWFDKKYKVIFVDGAKVEFTRNGEWKEVNCKFSAVPDGIVPAQILKYIDQNHEGAKVIEIDRDKRDIELKLNNRVELTFDLKYNIIDIDFD